MTTRLRQFRTMGDAFSQPEHYRRHGLAARPANHCRFSARGVFNPAATPLSRWGRYVLAGSRLKMVLPYAMYASTKPLADSPFHLSGEESTFAAGVRWDAFKAAALKLQVQTVAMMFRKLLQYLAGCLVLG